MQQAEEKHLKQRAVKLWAEKSCCKIFGTHFWTSEGVKNDWKESPYICQGYITPDQPDYVLG